MEVPYHEDKEGHDGGSGCCWGQATSEVRQVGERYLSKRCSGLVSAKYYVVVVVATWVTKVLDDDALGLDWAWSCWVLGI